MMNQPKFGTVEFFARYLNGQLEREVGANRQEVVNRVHYAMSSLIMEEFKGKEFITAMKNLHLVTERVSNEFERSKTL
jgi:hypothetical protein